MKLLTTPYILIFFKKMQLIQKPVLFYGEITDFYGNTKKSRAQTSPLGLHCRSYPAFMPQEQQQVWFVCYTRPEYEHTRSPHCRAKWKVLALIRKQTSALRFLLEFHDTPKVMITLLSTPICPSYTFNKICELLLHSFSLIRMLQC